MEKVIQWLQDEKAEIVAYQQQQWAEGKIQLAQNAEQITSWVEKISTFFN